MWKEEEAEKECEWVGGGGGGGGSVEERVIIQDKAVGEPLVLEYLSIFHYFFKSNYVQ